MDKKDAVILSKNYLEKVKQSGINVLDAWLFGSYAKDNYNENSDIDIALILPDNQMSFDTDVRLMVIRRGEEIRIETHTYCENDFLTDTPVIHQIKKYVFRI